MAKMGKAKHAKSSQRTKRQSVSATARKTAAKTEVLAKKAAAKTASKASAKTAENPAKKVVSQRLLEIIRERQAATLKAEKAAAKTPGRRGRRPKHPVEYVPENQEDENVTPENDHEQLHYDTGIQLKGGKDDGFTFERADEFEEELNFDM